MIHSAFFLIKEGLEGFRRARLSAAVATVTVTISITLFGVFLIITLNLSRYIDMLKNRMEIEVFLDDSFSDEKIQGIREQLSTIEGVRDVVFISKEMAIRAFHRLFEREPADYIEALGFNPLPASFRLKLEPNYLTSGQADRVVQRILAMDAIGAEDIRYDRRILLIIEKNVELAIVLGVIVGAIICLSALFLVSNNIRLIIFSRRKLIETMKLVGATPLFIQAPLFIQGVTQGFSGGLIASGFLYVIVVLSSMRVRNLIVVNPEVYPLMIILGAGLGLLGSLTAVRRYL